MTAQALSSTGGRTLTRRAVTGVPSRADLIDAAFVLALGTVALWGFHTTFDSLRFLVTGVIGLLLGLAVAHIAGVLKQAAFVLVLMTIATFFLFGGAVALTRDAIAGVLPDLDVLKTLGLLPVNGWKEFLTTLPPVDGSGQFLVLPYLMGLLAGVVGFSWARRSPAMAWPVLPSLVLLVLVILLGTIEPAGAVLQGLGFAVLAFLWVALRRRRRLRIVGTGGGARSQALIGASLVLAAVGSAVGLVHLSPGEGERTVLRTLVQAPFDITQYPSPLVGFRKYTEGAKRLWDKPLLTVEGLAAGQRLRFAVLDVYSGTVWSAGAQNSTTGSDFRRVGSLIAPADNDPRTPTQSVTVEVERSYAAQPDLSHWLPAPGSTSRVTFEGPRARTLSESLRYNTVTGQAVVGARLAEGDRIRLETRPVVDAPKDGFAVGQASVQVASAEFVQATASKWSAKADAPWAQVMVAAADMRSKGAYSDGTRQGEGHYLPGHGAGRLSRFLTGKQLVGNDEQYASVFALAANQLGVPARVVLGATVPTDGVVKGEHVHAWVEVRAGDGAWYAVPQNVFMPERDKRPDVNNPPPLPDANAANVPPPNAIRPPGALDALVASDPAAARSRTTAVAGFEIPEWVVTLAKAVGIPLALLGGFAALVAGIHALRRRRRRTRGAPNRRLALAWTEVVDRARDLGVRVDPGLTRKEQAAVIGFGGLAAQADAAVFRPGEPSTEDVERYWAATRTAMKDLTARTPLKRRLMRRFNLTSLLLRDPRPVEVLGSPSPPRRWLPRPTWRTAKAAS